MPQSLSEVYVHIVFSTKNRFPFLFPPIRKEMHRYIAGICTNLNCYPRIVNGTSDHVHIVCELARTISISEMVEEIKRGSSKWIKSKGAQFKKFHWQNGYGIFSVSASLLQNVIQYVQNQEQHHRYKSFQEEFRELLKAHGVQFDERYVWD
ncbi:MAG: IS200/IS605 family transposase [Calditrichaeota bacterium]|nr:IS200/IS605 family transposase [Calditrichota bacterium]